MGMPHTLFWAWLLALSSCTLIYDRPSASPSADGGNLPQDSGALGADADNDAPPPSADGSGDASPPACVPFPESGCSAELACYYPSTCAAPGGAPEGATCDVHEDCAPGHVCDGNICRAICLSNSDCYPCVSSGIEALLFVCE